MNSGDRVYLANGNDFRPSLAVKDATNESKTKEIAKSQINLSNIISIAILRIIRNNKEFIHVLQFDSPSIISSDYYFSRLVILSFIILH